MRILATADRELAVGGLVAGVDECGRGCLAGDVWAAAVIVPVDAAAAVAAVADSKALDVAKRQALRDIVVAHCHVGIGVASLDEIERLNILKGAMLAMTRAVAALPVVPDHVLVDGNRIPKGLPCPATAVVKGDASVRAIAAASIVAKVARDAAMAELHLQHPDYAWDRNAGYGTPDHLAAIRLHGITPYHRRTFAGVKEHVVRLETTPFTTDSPAIQGAFAL